MHEAVFVGVLQPERGLTHHFTSVGDASGPVLFDEVMQIDAVKKFHDQKRQAFCLTGIKRTNDVLMIQPSDRLDFSLETAGACGVHAAFGDNLQCHQLVEGYVSSAVDISMPPPPILSNNRY